MPPRNMRCRDSKAGRYPANSHGGRLVSLEPSRLYVRHWKTYCIDSNCSSSLLFPVDSDKGEKRSDDVDVEVHASPKREAPGSEDFPSLLFDSLPLLVNNAEWKLLETEASTQTAAVTV